MTSGLLITIAPPREARMPWLLAAARPRLRPLTSSFTHGAWRRTWSMLPSEEALSTTVAFHGRLGG